MRKQRQQKQQQAQQPEHQGSRRVGPPIPVEKNGCCLNRKGFILVPWGIVAIGGTIVMFWVMLAEWASRTPAPETWF